MPQYSYGGGSSSSSGRPSCWGNPAKYDNDDRECKGCSFQNSCRQETIRVDGLTKTALQQVPSVSSYYSQYQPPQPAQVHVQAPVPAPAPQFQPAPIVQYRPPVLAAPVPAPVPLAQRAPMTIPMQVRPGQNGQPSQFSLQLPPNYGDYGWYADPLPAIVAQNPAPFRPQLPGETFWERIFKNVSLGLAEVFLVTLLQGVRQSVWAPKPPVQQQG